MNAYASQVCRILKVNQLIKIEGTIFYFFLTHVSLWFMFLDPHLTTNHSTIGSSLIMKGERIQSCSSYLLICLSIYLVLEPFQWIDKPIEVRHHDTWERERERTTYTSLDHSCELICEPGNSKLRNITLVAIKVHMMLRSIVVLTWMHDKRKSV